MAPPASVPLSAADPPADSEPGRLRRRATLAAVAVAAGLIAVKFDAWLATGSVALLSSLIDSLLDLVASLVNLFAVRHALAPADREHRFGHGKAEPLAALGQSAFLIGGALLLIVEAVTRLVHPAPVAHSEAGIAVMALAIAVTIALVLYQRYVVRHTRSVAVDADQRHYRSDIVVNGSVIVALVLDRIVAAPRLDPVFGLAIGLWIIWNGTQVARLSLVQLMDHELPDAERARIRAIAEGHPEVVAVHDLRTRVAGPTAFVEMHVEMDGAMPLSRAHRISEAVSEDLHRAFPQAEIIIHQDPAGLDEPRRVFPPPGPSSRVETS
jgi:ferrous-iron efflux pump FieF